MEAERDALSCHVTAAPEDRLQGAGFSSERSVGFGALPWVYALALRWQGDAAVMVRWLCRGHARSSNRASQRGPMGEAKLPDMEMSAAAGQ